MTSQTSHLAVARLAVVAAMRVEVAASAYLLAVPYFEYRRLPKWTDSVEADCLIMREILWLSVSVLPLRCYDHPKVEPPWLRELSVKFSVELRGASCEKEKRTHDRSSGVAGCEDPPIV